MVHGVNGANVTKTVIQEQVIMVQLNALIVLKRKQKMDILIIYLQKQSDVTTKMVILKMKLVIQNHVLWIVKEIIKVLVLVVIGVMVACSKIHFK